MPVLEKLLTSSLVTEIGLVPTSIYGRVTDGSGSPLEGRTAVLFIDDGMYRLASTLTNANGEYSFIVGTDSHTPLAVVIIGSTGEDSKIHSKLIAG